MTRIGLMGADFFISRNIGTSFGDLHAHCLNCDSFDYDDFYDSFNPVNHINHINHSSDILSKLIRPLLFWYLPDPGNCLNCDSFDYDDSFDFFLILLII